MRTLLNPDQIAAIVVDWFASKGALVNYASWQADHPVAMLLVDHDATVELPQGR